MKKIVTLNDALLIKISALYDVETQITKALPKIIKNTINFDLKKAFSNHLEETKVQVKRLEEIFNYLDVKPKKTKVEAIRGMIADTEWIIDAKPEGIILDSMLIAAASYVEHYEMAGYLTAYRWANELGLNKVADLLRVTLDEEVLAADMITSIAEESVDSQAV